MANVTKKIAKHIWFRPASNKYVLVIGLLAISKPDFIKGISFLVYSQSKLGSWTSNCYVVERSLGCIDTFLILACGFPKKKSDTHSICKQENNLGREFEAFQEHSLAITPYAVV